MTAIRQSRIIIDMQTIIETPDFLSDEKTAGLNEQERFDIVRTIAKNPEAGDVIPGTGGARKVRFAGRGRGKSGGFRVITFYSGPDVPVFLLNIFAKGDKINLTHAERNELRAILADIVAAYRQGTRRNDQSRK
ncbi:MAG: RelE cytotoxic translational repressor of toxin-antitoxin stability system [Candidatus Entotheonella gemina]|uniref:RelE cytotoxic translational repressor of toxin-antitoxin stability system n=2 Tax=Candidatus Entotheonella TaxID=93171 RepID=W4MD14_9BACT|nr:MAG: RelE cytotoxic translational repressor of toxin-antitoxin stability system [Candidatus Entotheonella gemina]